MGIHDSSHGVVEVHPLLNEIRVLVLREDGDVLLDRDEFGVVLESCLNGNDFCVLGKDFGCFCLSLRVSPLHHISEVVYEVVGEQPIDIYY